MVRHCLTNLSELKRQFNSSLYERLALSKDKGAVARLVNEGQVIESPQELVKDPYVLEFLGLSELPNYSETELESKIINNLQTFLLELGTGFGTNTSYSHKVLFYAQTRYLMINPDICQNKFEDWMRVVRNIVSRADLTPDGKRSDIIRSPETFNGAIGLVNELANGCNDIYAYLCSASISSIFAREHVKEEILKARIIQSYPEYKELLFRTEYNELLRGRITFALQCAGYQTKISEIDFEMLVLKLTQADYDSILAGFTKPDRAYCYLMRGKRPSDIVGSIKVE